MEEIGVFEQERANIGGMAHMSDDPTGIGSELTLENRCQDVISECLKFKNVIFNKIEKVR